MPSSNGEVTSSESAESASAVFAHAGDFVITGGNFTNINHPPPKDPYHFRTIPLGDLILNHEICCPTDPSRVIRLRKPWNYVRKVYSAEIFGLQSPFTVALLVGPGAEEQWKNEVALYSNLRHPNLLQLYGITTSGRIHALIFHDDVVPWRDFHQQYNTSHFYQVFFFINMNTQIQVASQHVQHILGRKLCRTDCSVWIRPSKGVLHIGLTPPESKATSLDTSDHQHTPLLAPFSSFLNPPHASELMRSISLESYHDLCHWDLSYYRWFTAPTGMQIQLGYIVYVPNLAEGASKLDGAFPIAGIPDVSAATGLWGREDAHVDEYWHPIMFDKGTSMLPETGWIRVHSACVVDRYSLYSGVDPSLLKAWMAQASHIFASLEIRMNREEYVFLRAAQWLMHFSGSVDDLPPGYLFLCPPNQFTSDRPYQVPDFPAYWSLDPSGSERLTPEEAGRMGFPELQLVVKICGIFGMDDFYTGMREFHAAKGYDPGALDVANDLGYPLYQLACEKDQFHTYLRHLGKENKCHSSIEVVDSTTDETGFVVEEENDLFEDAAPGVYHFNQLGETEVTQPPPREMLIIYIQLALIGTCFALTLFGL
ncbi:hypothetical protein FB45DRAFT_299366 [Roridomyces roridus]|uniref:Uncharacterized protein n=1 Tax=Roridomyces roridus TaxID=1738132 RepID=A0AAD7CCS3_9AGAR|nr:hypothetical protein FB45DRAFT_299366 [Roridomyces roridus]